LARLTKREREIVVLLGRGLRDKAIASQLGLSVHTVRNHIANARRCVGAANRAHLVAITNR
jgi:DNA-binding CsgD family transcriptional regulator